MSEQVIDREEIETMMWMLADIFVLARETHSVFFGEDDEEEEERDA